MLWIALFLPALPLQLVQRGADVASSPLVIAEGPPMRPLVCCANTEAQERGVTPGMAVAAARALAGELRVLPRDTNAETQALHNLACWAGQFTPSVSLQGAGLLLEVRSTLHLYGGLKALLGRVRKGIAQLGYQAAPGVAPTPLGAWMLARARHAGLAVRMCKDKTLLPDRLAALPLTLLDWPVDVLQPLQALGIHSIGQCAQLPRDGFIRRFGRERRRDLDQALGILPDPRVWFSPPDTFASRLEFGFELADALMLLFPLKRLLRELEGFLRSRGAGVQEWHLVLEHMSQGRTRLAIGTAAPERSTERFLALARERLTQTTLSAPVLGLGITVERLVAFEEHNQSFVPDPKSRAIGWTQLIDKLSARLGNDKIYKLRTLDDHRPEHAWQRCAATTVSIVPVPAVTAPLPLWLLATPRALSGNADTPRCRGPLRLVAGPQRLEAGWWDGLGACRDYYVARNPHGETLWIYREHRREAPWYLHGIFA
jgi:protein ImuB